jgi:hypothetical protein
MKFSVAGNMWQDTDYTYLNQNKQERPARLFLKGFSDPNNSPGAKGAYTTLGTFNHIDVTGD